MGARSHRRPFGVSGPADPQRLALLVHEVRSPVAALAALADAWRDERLDRAGRRSLAGLAIAACRGIERVVTDAAIASVRLEDVDSSELVAETAEAARLRGALVEATAEPGLPTIRADPVRIRQALDNLVANALTHAPSAEAVLVSARVEGGELLLSVTDAGAGIPLDEHSRIFDPGVRLDASRPGSGLGLAVVRAIADAHGADLRLDSAPGRGSTFTLAFRL
jgi:two-component system, OmpR family, sensor histidine kinase BaeS